MVVFGFETNLNKKPDFIIIKDSFLYMLIPPEKSIIHEILLFKRELLLKQKLFILAHFGKIVNIP